MQGLLDSQLVSCQQETFVICFLGCFHASFFSLIVLNTQILKQCKNIHTVCKTKIKKILFVVSKNGTWGRPHIGPTEILGSDEHGAEVL